MAKKTVAKKIVKKPTMAQLHDLAVGIALQSIEEQFDKSDADWDNKIDAVLANYAQAMYTLEKYCDKASANR